MQWWEIFLPNKPLSRRSRSPRPPLLPQIQRDLGCNSVLPRINCSEWILHLASSVSRGVSLPKGTCHRMRIPALCKVSQQRGGKWLSFWSWVHTIEFPDPLQQNQEINGAGEGMTGRRFSSIYKANNFHTWALFIIDWDFGGRFWDNARDSWRGGGCTPAIIIVIAGGGKSS